MRGLSVKTKQALIVAVVFVAFAAGVTSFAFRYFEAAYRKSVSHDLMLMSAALADNIDSRLAIAENALGAAKAALPPDTLADPVLTQKFIDERVTLRNIFPDAVLVISPGGHLLAANGSKKVNPAQDFSRQDFFATVVSRKAPYLSVSAEHPGNHAEVTVAFPVTGPRGDLGAIVVGINELVVSKLSIEKLLREKIGAGSHLYIAAQDGRYLLHRGANVTGEKVPDEQRPLLESALAGVDIVREIGDCAGEPALASFQKLDRINSVLVISYPLSLAYAPLENAKKGFLWAVVLGTTLLVIITWIAATWIIQPLQTMTAHVKMLPELPPGKRLLGLERDDEVGILAKSFDQLVVTLENREAELLRLNQKYRQRAADLAEMNRDLEAFSSSLSHDLKTPLTSVSIAAEALRESLSAREDANVRYFLTTILAESERMSGLIDGMLLLSRASKDDIHHVDVNLSGIAREILLRLNLAHPARKVEWAVAPDVTAVGDERLLLAAMENLLGNAWKYTGTREIARIEFGALAETPPVFFVKDNGVGFDMAEAGQLFKPFQRLHGQDTFKGFGIGLATVERIVQRHGGRIWASALPEQGATFFFTLPVEASPLPETGNAAT